MAKLVTVVVMNWNGRKYLEGCLPALSRQGFKNFDVILVDNGSTDDSVKFVKSKYPRIKIIENRKNLGVAEATNIGFRAAKGKYIVSLHNDAVPERDWLKRLVGAIEKSPRNVACIEGAVHHFGDVGVINGSLNVLSYNIIDAFDDPRKKFYSGTCSMIIRRGLMEEYCDPVYFFYQEDVKMGWLLRLRGFDIRRAPDSMVMHHGTVSARCIATKKRYQFLSERNRLLNFFTLYETKNVAKLLPLLAFHACLTLAKDAARSRWKFAPHVEAYLWVVAHIGTVRKKRRDAQSVRAVRDCAITPMMSSKLVTGDHPLNTLSLAYCRMAGIRTVEG